MIKIIQTLGLVVASFYATTANAQQKTIAETPLGSSGITFEAVMDISTIVVTLTGPSDRWFGAGIGNSGLQMNGDVLLYSTGKPGAVHPEEVRDYTLGGTGSSNVTDDVSEDWTPLNGINGVVSGSTRTLTLLRDLNTGDAQDKVINFNDATLYVIFARGSSTSMELAYHGGGGARGNQLLTWVDVDVTPPFLVNTNPADNAVNVAINSNLTATFSEPIIANIGSFEIYLATNNTVVESIGVLTPQAIIAGNQLILNPMSDLLPNTAYYVRSVSGAVKDAANNVFTGINDVTTWSFTTAAAAGDVTAPILAVSPFSPADNAMNVAINTPLVITFNENIALGAGTIAIINSATSGVVQTFGAAASVISGASLTLTLSAPLANNTPYHVFINSNAVTDIAGNGFVGGPLDPTVWNFTTIAASDVTAPMLLASPFSPADNSTITTVNPTLTIQFNENITVAPTLINLVKTVTSNVIQVFDNTSTVVSGSTITLTLAAPLTSNTAYHVTIAGNAIKDAANNFYAGFTNATTWNFATSNIADIQNIEAPINYVYQDQKLMITPKSSDLSTVKIINLQGQTLMETKSVSNETLVIATEKFGQQMIILLVETEGKVWTKKISL